MLQAHDNPAEQNRAVNGAEHSSRFRLTLYADRGLTVDKSIQWAYIHAIRNARHFLYIENQYFLGGSGEWENKVRMPGGGMWQVEPHAEKRLWHNILAAQPSGSWTVFVAIRQGSTLHLDLLQS